MSVTAHKIDDADRPGAGADGEAMSRRKPQNATQRAEEAAREAEAVLSGHGRVEAPRLDREVRLLTGGHIPPASDDTPATRREMVEAMVTLLALHRQTDDAIDRLGEAQDATHESIKELRTEVKSIPDAIEAGRAQAKEQFEGAVADMGKQIAGMGDQIAALKEYQDHPLLPKLTRKQKAALIAAMPTLIALVSAGSSPAGKALKALWAVLAPIFGG